MSDITIEEAIRIMQTEQAYANERYATDTYRYYRVDKAYSKAIESLENQKTGHWIPVSERLPKEDESVLLTICANSSLYGFNKNFIKVMCGSYSPCEDKRDWIVNGIRYYIDNVIAWMPLPEPYKAESEG